MKAKPRLGRGLSGLINRTDEAPAPSARTTAPAPAPAVDVPAAASGLDTIPVADVRPNPFQPRKQFSPEELADLVASIREVGILQPVVVRRGALGYELIAGERRLRASREAGLTVIPAVIRTASDDDMQVWALVENLQRVDLNAVEKARALRSLMRNLQLTQDAVAKRVGKARATIANLVRLLDLPDDVQSLVESGQLGGAHARAVLLVEGREHRIQLARAAAEGGWSVREVERRAKALKAPSVRKAPPAAEDVYLQDLERRLRQSLGTKVLLRGKSGGGGTIEVHYHDASELDRLLEHFESEQ